MKNRLYLSLVLISLTCLAGRTAHAQLQRSSPARQTWEYIIVQENDGVMSIRDYLGHTVTSARSDNQLPTLKGGSLH